jgi:hypothetical protein
MSNICPICNKDDAIRKVSAVVSAGQSAGVMTGSTIGMASSDGDGSLAGGYTVLSGNTSTLLVKKLAPLAKPAGLSCLIWGLAIYPGLILIILGPPALLGAIIPYSMTIYNELPTGVLDVVIAIWVILITFFYLRFIKQRHDSKLRKEKYRYQIQMELWSRLYYCFRDDIVFDPQSGNHFPPEAFSSFLETQYKNL